MPARSLTWENFAGRISRNLSGFFEPKPNQVRTRDIIRELPGAASEVTRRFITHGVMEPLSPAPATFKESFKQGLALRKKGLYEQMGIRSEVGGRPIKQVPYKPQNASRVAQIINKVIPLQQTVYSDTGEPIMPQDAQTLGLQRLEGMQNFALGFMGGDLVGASAARNVAKGAAKKAAKDAAPWVAAYAAESRLAPILGKAKQKATSIALHADDQKVMSDFIDYARLGGSKKNPNPKLELDASRIAEHYGLKMPKTLSGLANEFDNALSTLRQGKPLTRKVGGTPQFLQDKATGKFMGSKATTKTVFRATDSTNKGAALGKGQYFARTPEEAALYGKKVEKFQAPAGKMLKLKTDDELAGFTQKAIKDMGPAHLKMAEKEGMEAATAEAMKRYAKKQGYAGIESQYPFGGVAFEGLKRKN